MPIKEGAASITVNSGVFYNPKMSKLRDISVLFLKAASTRRAKLLDATAATGVRGIRYSLEAGIKEVSMIDINDVAYRNAVANARANGLQAKTYNLSLQELANRGELVFDVIDVDPFGSPAPMVHDALKLASDKTLLMITATDTATLCGAENVACLRVYASRPIHNELCQEAGIRILLGFVAREAAQFNFGVEPLLCIADMHYMRLFVRLHRGAKEAVHAIKECGLGAYCTRCHNFSFKKGAGIAISSLCDNCGKEMEIFGPLWLGSLQDKTLLAKMLKVGRGYPQESLRLIEKIKDELDTPFFYSVPKITSYLGRSSVPINFIVEKLSKKYTVSRTHFEKDAIKTVASIKEVLKAVKA